MRHVNGESVESATSTLPARNRCGITGISPVLENVSGAGHQPQHVPAMFSLSRTIRSARNNFGVFRMPSAVQLRPDGSHLVRRTLSQNPTAVHDDDVLRGCCVLQMMRCHDNSPPLRKQNVLNGLPEDMLSHWNIQRRKRIVQQNRRSR